MFLLQASLYERSEHIDSTDSGISCLGDLLSNQLLTLSPLPLHQPSPLHRSPHYQSPFLLSPLLKSSVNNEARGISHRPAATSSPAADREQLLLLPGGYSSSASRSSGSPNSVAPRTPYGHRIHLPLVDYRQASPPPPLLDQQFSKRSNQQATDEMTGHSTDDPLARRSADDPLGGRSAEGPLGGRSADDPLGYRSADDPLGGRSAEDPLGGPSAEGPLSGLERLVRSHAIWFLPAVTREEAVSFLHAKEEGVGHRTIVYNKLKLILHATP